MASADESIKGLVREATVNGVAESELAVQVNGYRGMSTERKLEIAWGLRAFAIETKLASLRQRYPAASEAAIRGMLRELLSAEPA